MHCRIHWGPSKPNLTHPQPLPSSRPLHPLHASSQLGKRLSLRLPLRKGMRCSTPGAHRSLIYNLNRHIRKDHANDSSGAQQQGPGTGVGGAAGAQGREAAKAGAGGGGGGGAGGGLSIYRPPSGEGRGQGSQAAGGRGAGGQTEAGTSGVGGEREGATAGGAGTSR